MHRYFYSKDNNNISTIKELVLECLRNCERHEISSNINVAPSLVSLVSVEYMGIKRIQHQINKDRPKF